MYKALRSRENHALDPKPVHPTAVRTHGLFGIPYLRQHMIMDECWTIRSLSDEYKNMTDLLARRLIFKRLEFNANRKRYNYENSLLRRQCREGRAKLQMALFGENAHKLRNELINHKDMQRLYQHMPIHLAFDNINQRTFVMRKERDRLRFRLDTLKDNYKNKLLERAVLENRIKYQNEYVLEEEKKSSEFIKKIENSNVRLRAIKTINGTYKKIIQVLRHDAIFFEPILRSLNNDIDDQTKFIKHVLHLGIPAISKFKELGEEYTQLENKTRKHNQDIALYIASYRNKEISHSAVPKRIVNNSLIKDRYERETKSMLTLQEQLQDVENVIKSIKFATLCSQAREIFPRMKSTVDNNFKLKKMIENDMLGHNTLDIKMKRAKTLEGVLIHNLSKEQIMNVERIQTLQNALDNENKIYVDVIKYLKNRADAYTIFRFALWNLSETLRYVDHKPRAPPINYPNSYLKLPLLKFEMQSMRAYPPDFYEEDLDIIMRLVTRKISKLMGAYTKELNDIQKAQNQHDYHTIYLNTLNIVESDEDEKKQEEDQDVCAEIKTLQNVPTRRQIKAESAKIVEDFSKRED